MNINVTDAPISQVMDQILNGTSLTYKELGNNLIVLVQKNEVVQDIIVKGKITDKATGQPLAGASIQIKGSNSGTTTDAKGNYSINVPGKATLIVSSVDYDNVEIPVNGRTVINVSMQVSATGLNEVVVVGYGKQKKSDLTGAITSLSSDDLTKGGTISNVAQAIQGKAAGVQVIQNSSAPGGSISIRIRGNNSINSSNEPLYVVDGFPTSNGKLMYQEFIVKKQTGTYSEAIEAYGLANLVNEILQRSESKGYKTIIEDNGPYYLVSINKEITDEIFEKLSYFQVIKFIKKETNQDIPSGILDLFDYPQQKEILDNYKKRFLEIEKNKQLNTEQKKEARRKINEEKLSEFGQKIDPEYDVFREIKGNPYASFNKLFDNFHQNQAGFKILIREILNFYTEKISPKRDFKLSDEKPTAQQLYNPSQGKGLNKNKANNISMGNLNSEWIPETMKISGALSMMVCQYVKVGSGYDLKIYVPEFNNILFSEAKNIMLDFKRNLNPHCSKNNDFHFF